MLPVISSCLANLDWWCFYSSVCLANLVAEHAACAVACTLSFCSRFESPESTAPVSSRWSAMSVKPIREHAGKALLEKLLPEISGGKHKMGHAGVLVTPSVLDSTSNGSWDKILEQNPWLKTTNLVAKPDQLIKRRGKAGLIAVNKTFDEAKQWVMDRMCKEQESRARDWAAHALPRRTFCASQARTGTLHLHAFPSLP